MSDDFDDLDLDNFDLPDFNDDGLGPVGGNRKPIERAADGILEGAGEAIKSPANYRKMIEKGMPKGYGDAIAEANKVTGTIGELYDNAAKELEPAKKNLKKIGRFAADKLEKVAPEALIKKLREASAENEYKEQFDAEQGEILGALSSIFGQQQIADEEQKQTDEVKHEENVAIGKSSLDNLTVIARNTSRMAEFNDNISLKVMKKSLELQYKQYFTAKRQYELLEAYAKESSQNLKAIVANSALPDFLKIRSSEAFKQHMIQRTFGNITGTISASTSGLLEKFKANANAKIKSLGTEVRGKIEGFADTIDMMRDMEEQGIDKLQMKASMVGDLGVSAGMAKLAEMLYPYINKNEKVRNIGTDLEYVSSNYMQIARNKIIQSTTKDDTVYVGKVKLDPLKMTAGEYIDELTGKVIKSSEDITGPVIDTEGRVIADKRDFDKGVNVGNSSGIISKAVGLVKDQIKPLIPGYDSSVKIARDPKEMLINPGFYSEATDITIRDVIPELLTSIHQEVKTIRTKSKDLVPKDRYNWYTGQFEEESDLVANIKERVMPLDNIKSVTEKYNEFLELIDPNKELDAHSRINLIETLLSDVMEGNGYFSFERMANLDYDEKYSDKIRNHISKLGIGNDKLSGPEKSKKLRNALSKKYNEMQGDVPAWQDAIRENTAIFGTSILNKTGFLNGLEGDSNLAKDELLKIFRPKASSTPNEEMVRQMYRSQGMSEDQIDALMGTTSNNGPTEVLPDKFARMGDKITDTMVMLHNKLDSALVAYFDHTTKNLGQAIFDFEDSNNKLLKSIYDLLDDRLGPQGPDDGGNPPSGPEDQGGDDSGPKLKRGPMRRVKRTKTTKYKMDASDIGFTSDERSKKIIEMGGNESKLRAFLDAAKLRFGSWTSKITNKKDSGTFTQDLKKLMPGVVSESDETGYKYDTVNLKGLTTWLTQSMSGAAISVRNIHDKIEEYREENNLTKEELTKLVKGLPNSPEIKKMLTKAIETKDVIDEKSRNVFGKIKDFKLKIPAKSKSSLVDRYDMFADHEFSDDANTNLLVKTIHVQTDILKDAIESSSMTGLSFMAGDGDPSLMKDLKKAFKGKMKEIDGPSKLSKLMQKFSNYRSKAGGFLGKTINSGMTIGGNIRDTVTRLTGLAKEKLESTVYFDGFEGAIMTQKDFDIGRFYDSATGKLIKSIDDLKNAKGDIYEVGVDRPYITLMEITSGKLRTISEKITHFNKDGVIDVLSKGRDKLLSMTKFNYQMLSKITGGVADKLLNGKDIYLSSDLDNPVIRANLLKIGYYHFKEDGRVLTNVKDIDGDIVDSEGNVVLRLSDLQNNELVTRDGIVVKLGKGIGATASSMFNYGKKTLTGVIDTYKKLGKGILNKIRNRARRMANESPEELHSSITNDILASIYELLDERLSTPKDVDGDLNGDGLRDNSWQARRKRRKEKEKATLSRIVTTKGIHDFAGQAAANDATGDGDGDGDTNINIERGEKEDKKRRKRRGKSPKKPRGKLGRLAHGAKRIGGRALGAAGKVARMIPAVSALGGVGSGIIGTAGTLASGAMSIGGSILGAIPAIAGTALSVGGSILSAGATAAGALASVLSAPVIIGGLAAAAAGYGAYKAYKYFTRPELSGPLHELRFMQYGFKSEDTDSLERVNNLESLLIDRAKISGGSVSFDFKGISDEQLAEAFDIDVEDAEEAAKFAVWVKYRFKPVFATALAAYHSIKGKFNINEIESLSKEDKIKYFKAVSVTDKNAYRISANPNPDEDYTLLGAETIASKVKELKSLYGTSNTVTSKDDKKEEKPNMTGKVAEAAKVAEIAKMADGASNDPKHDTALSSITERISKDESTTSGGKGKSSALLASKSSGTMALEQNNEMVGIMRDQFLVMKHMAESVDQIRDMLAEKSELLKNEEKRSMWDLFSGDDENGSNVISLTSGGSRPK